MSTILQDQLKELVAEIGQVLYALRTATGLELTRLTERLERLETRKITLLNR